MSSISDTKQITNGSLIKSNIGPNKRFINNKYFYKCTSILKHEKHAKNSKNEINLNAINNEERLGNLLSINRIVQVPMKQNLFHSWRWNPQQEVPLSGYEKIFEKLQCGRTLFVRKADPGIFL